VTYAEFRERLRFNHQELLAFAHGTLLEDAPPAVCARLPLPPLLMLDRIVTIERGPQRGRIVAERDIHLDDWFFQCHFLGDPVQPGCLGVDAIWQLIGFYCACSGHGGAGRALGCGEVEFFGQVRPHDHTVRYEVDVRRVTELSASGATLAIGDGTVFVDDSPIYSIKRAKVGLFSDIVYPDYPNPSPRSRGGGLALSPTAP